MEQVSLYSPLYIFQSTNVMKIRVKVDIPKMIKLKIAENANTRSSNLTYIFKLNVCLFSYIIEIDEA